MLPYVPRPGSPFPGGQERSWRLQGPSLESPAGTAEGFQCDLPLLPTWGNSSGQHGCSPGGQQPACAKAAMKQLLGCGSKRESKPRLTAPSSSENWDSWSWEQQREVQAQHIPLRAQPRRLLLTPPSTGVPRGLKWGVKAGESTKSLITIFTSCVLQGFAHTQPEGAWLFLLVSMTAPGTRAVASTHHSLCHRDRHPTSPNSIWVEGHFGSRS